jgi:hypothetical protein
MGILMESLISAGDKGGSNPMTTGAALTSDVEDVNSAAIFEAGFS